MTEDDLAKDHDKVRDLGRGYVTPYDQAMFSQIPGFELIGSIHESPLLVSFLFLFLFF